MKKNSNNNSEDLILEKVAEVVHYIKFDVEKYADMLLNLVESREAYNSSDNKCKELMYSQYDIALVILQQTTVAIRRKAYEAHEQWLKDNGYVETETDWEDIPGYSRYQVSRYGHVRVKETGAIKRPGFAGPYPRVSIVPDEQKKAARSVGNHVYQLVADAFLDKIPGKTLPDHINENTLDSRAENLQWSDNVENSNMIRSFIRKVKSMLTHQPVMFFNHYFPSRQNAFKTLGISTLRGAKCGAYYHDYDYKIDGEQFPGIANLSEEEIKRIHDVVHKFLIQCKDLETGKILIFENYRVAANYIQPNVKIGCQSIVSQLAKQVKQGKGKPVKLFGYEWAPVDPLEYVQNKTVGTLITNGTK